MESTDHWRKSRHIFCHNYVSFKKMCEKKVPKFKVGSNMPWRIQWVHGVCEGTPKHKRWVCEVISYKAFQTFFYLMSLLNNWILELLMINSFFLPWRCFLRLWDFCLMKVVLESSRYVLFVLLPPMSYFEGDKSEESAIYLNTSPTTSTKPEPQ